MAGHVHRPAHRHGGDDQGVGRLVGSGHTVSLLAHRGTASLDRYHFLGCWNVIGGRRHLTVAPLAISLAWTVVRSRVRRYQPHRPTVPCLRGEHWGTTGLFRYPATRLFSLGLSVA